MTTIEFPSVAEAWAEVEADYNARPATADACKLGAHHIARGVVPPGRPTLYILGFNGGEPADAPAEGPSRAAKKWFAQCERARKAVGAEGYLIVERCHWGSPNVPELRRRLGDDGRLRAMLRLHAVANRALFVDYPPLVVWAPGVSTFMREAIEDYGLTETASLIQAKRNRRDTVWRLYETSDGAPFLFTKHPAARPSAADSSAIMEKLGDLAAERQGTFARLLAERRTGLGAPR